MGVVVPVAEPEWSGAHHGLCLYASRVLQAVWDEQVRRTGMMRWQQRRVRRVRRVAGGDSDTAPRQQQRWRQL